MPTTPTPPIEELLAIPSGSQVYDALMYDIEPELLTDNLQHLDEKYADETAEGRAMRYKRYEKAFATYDAVFTKWIDDLAASVQTFKKDAMKTAEAQTRDEEAQHLLSLEEQMNIHNPSLA